MRARTIDDAIRDGQYYRLEVDGDYAIYPAAETPEEAAEWMSHDWHEHRGKVANVLVGRGPNCWAIVWHSHGTVAIPDPFTAG